MRASDEVWTIAFCKVLPYCEEEATNLYRPTYRRLMSKVSLSLHAVGDFERVLIGLDVEIGMHELRFLLL